MLVKYLQTIKTELNFSFFIDFTTYYLTILSVLLLLILLGNERIRTR